jgi:hypothetical protein
MSWLFTLLFFIVPATAYANVDYEFEKFLYNNTKFHFKLHIKTPNEDEILECIDYVPTVMQIYLNSFALQQYRTNNYTLIAEKLSWTEIKIGVKYYF